MTLSRLLIGLLVIILHEAGHIIAARTLGLNIKRIGVSWKGPYIVRESGPPAANMITTLSGPLFNVVLAGMAWTGAHDFAMANLIFGISNLVPMAGSDGQRVLMQLSNRVSSAAAGRPILLS
jgi:Zn-dependent protease